MRKRELLVRFLHTHRLTLFILACSYILLTISLLGSYYASYYAYYRVHPFSFGMEERVYVLDDPEAKDPISDEQIEALLTLDSITILAFNENTDTIGIYDPD